MVRHYPQDIADSRRSLAIREIKEPVLLGHVVDSRLGVFEDQPEPVQTAGIRGECLRARIQNAAPVSAAADHAGEDLQRTIVNPGDAGSHHHPVIENTGAGTVLGGALEAPQIHKVGRAAGRNDLRNEAEVGKAFARGIEKLLCRRPAVRRRIEKQAAKLQPRVVPHHFCQRHCLARGFDPGPFPPGVAFDEDIDGAVRRVAGLGIGGKRYRIVGADFQGHPALKRRQPAGSRRADDIGGDQDVPDPGLRHHLGLAKLLAGDADGAGRELPLREEG